MTTFYLDRRECQLAHHNGTLVVREPGEAPRHFPMRSLERLVLVGNQTLESSLLTRLAEQGSSVLLMDGRGAGRALHIHASNHGDAARRLGQYRLCNSSEQTLAWAKRFVFFKLCGHVRLLKKMLNQRPDQRLALFSALQESQPLLGKVRQAKDLDQLRGLEGAAAASFFAAFACVLPPSVGFSGRNRRPPRDPVNATLSLTYTLVMGDAVRALHLSGLDPLLGCLHEPSHHRDSLACDLLEIARPRIDGWVWRLFAEQTLRASDFELHAGGCQMKKAARVNFYPLYENGAEVHRRWFRRLAQAFAKDCQKDH
jgi:CRISPR-associated protein Cas1